MPTSFPPVRAIRPAPPGVHYVPTGLVLASLLVVGFVAGHVPFIPDTRDGVDSTNFILAIDRYDPGLHQPHPPGYPVHVAIGRLVNSTLKAIAPVGSQAELATPAASLRIWSVVSGALALLSLMWIAAELGASVPRAWLVAALAAACPLFWVTAMRPLSDVPGLFLSLMSQALALSAYNRWAASARDTGATELDRAGGGARHRLLASALLAGIAVGVRVQTALLTMPLLALVAGLRAWRGDRRLILPVLLAALLGLLAWAVPMIFAVGGPAEYVRLLTTVANDDVAGVEMLAAHPSPRLLALALFRTFIVPWSSGVLGWAVFALIALGGLRLARHNRRVLGAMAAMGLPYLAFHLLFQESASIRYALPLVPLCAVAVVARLPSRPTAVMSVAIAGVLVAASVLSIRAATAYGRSESPVARALEDIKHEAGARPQAATLAYHHSVARAVRGEGWPGRVLPSNVRYEWLELASYWLEGGRAPVWFLADGRRTDLALVDPVSRKLMRSYRWPASAETLLGGIQPPSVTWYEIVSPGWFVMRGWALTPEARGLAQRDGHAAGTTGLVGHIRRRDDAAMLMIGGRNLGGPAETGARVELAIDGRTRASWLTSPGAPFLEVIPIAAGELRGDGVYATVTVKARDAADTARIVDVAVEHFDVQSPGAALGGYDHGWQMPELDPATGQSWRWVDQVADLRVEGFGRDVEIVLRGESPMRNFQHPPRVVVRAGRTVLASFRPDADFEWIIPAPATALAASEGRVTIESDQSFVPDEVSGNGDRRRLSLRIFGVETRPARSSARPAEAR